MAGSQGSDPMAYPQPVGMPIQMQPAPTLNTRPALQGPGPGPGFRQPPPSPSFGARPDQAVPTGFRPLEKPGPGAVPGGGMSDLDQWGQLLPPRLQAQIAAGLPLEQAVGRFQGQLQQNQEMPSWQNPAIQALMGGGRDPYMGGPGGGPGFRQPPRSPMNISQKGGGRSGSAGDLGKIDEPQAYPMPNPAHGIPLGDEAERGPGSAVPTNLFDQALARQTRPRFDQGVRGGGYDWKKDRDRALGQGEFGPAVPAPEPSTPVLTRPRPDATDDLGSKPPVYTKPAPKGGRRPPRFG